MESLTLAVALRRTRALRLTRALTLTLTGHAAVHAGRRTGDLYLEDGVEHFKGIQLPAAV